MVRAVTKKRLGGTVGASKISEEYTRKKKKGCQKREK
jgi:hypothetical protein